MGEPQVQPPAVVPPKTVFISDETAWDMFVRVAFWIVFPLTLFFGAGLIWDVTIGKMKPGWSRNKWLTFDHYSKTLSGSLGLPVYTPLSYF